MNDRKTNEIHRVPQKTNELEHGVHLVGYNSVADSTGLSSVVLPLLPLKPAKFRENSNLQQFMVIQGHRPWCQSKAHMQLPISY